MDFFFNPRGIALIGATPNPLKGGHAILRNLRSGFDGGIYPVNPSYAEIEGMSCYPSILEVPDPVDLGIVFVPAPLVPQVVRECSQRGIPGVMIESGGFAETGESGTGLQEAIKEVVRKSDIRVWGPNCMGLVDTVKRYIFSFVTPEIWDYDLKQGKVSMIVQSGMLSGAFLIDLMTRGVMGVSKVCSIGNKADVDECDILEYLIDDMQTEAICLYLESIDRGRRFYELCKRSTKPVVLLKGGKSKKGAAAAMSHTASMAGNYNLIRGVMNQAGVVEASGFRQMADFGRTLARYPHLPEKRDGKIAVLAYSGGAGIVSSDFLESMGLETAELSRTTLHQLKSISPEWMPLSNPVDLWPAVERNGARKAFGTAMRAVCGDPGVDGVLLHAFSGGFALNVDIAELANIAKAARKPLLCWLLGERDATRDFQARAQDLGVPVFRELRRAAECMSVVFEKRPAPLSVEEAKTQTSPELSESFGLLLTSGTGTLGERVSKQILAEFGIPVVGEKIADDETNAVEAAVELGFPVVMKGLVPDMLHKTEEGLVKLGLQTEKDVRKAFALLKGKIDRNYGKIVVQPQVAAGIEIIAGMVRDAQFGPCVMCGFGGILAEAIEDSVFAAAPLTREEALDMIGRLKRQKLLDGFRGFPAVKREQLAKVLVNLGRFGTDYPRIAEIDVNPMIATEQGLIAVDAVMVLSRERIKD